MTAIKHLKNVEYADNLINLQDIMNEMNDTNILVTIEKLLTTDFVKNEDGIYTIIENIATLPTIKVGAMDYIGEFCRKFLNNCKLFDFGKMLLIYLLRTVDDANYLAKVPHYLILRACIEQEIYSDNDYIPSMNELFRNNMYNQFALMFLIFMPIIEEENEEFYFSVFPILQDLSKSKQIHEKLTEVLKKIDAYQKDGYLVLRSGLTTRQDYQIVSLLQNDNADALDRLKIDPNATLTYSIFEPIQILQNSPTLIQAAAFYGSVKCLNKLHKNGAKLHRKDLLGWNVAPYALASGNADILNEIDKVNISFEKTLQFAAIYRRYETFEWLIQHRQKDIHDINKELRNVLCASVRSNNVRTFMNCLERGQSIRNRDRKGENAILAAANGGYLSFMQLIAMFDNCDINSADNEEKTSAHIAAMQGNLPMIQFLMKNNASFLSRDSDGMTPLHHASEKGNYKAVKLMLSSSDVNAKDNLGRTPLHAACEENYQSVVEVLVQAGANKSIVDRSGNTPIMLTTDEEIKNLLR